MIKLRNLITILVIILIGLFILSKVGVFRTVEIDFVQKINKVLIGNEMVVKTSNEVNLKKVKINIANSINTVFVDGEFLNNIGEIKNGPKFDIYYKNTLIGKALHNNTEGWYVNKFVFNFFVDNNRVRFNFSSRGFNKNDNYIWIDKKKGKLTKRSFDSDGKLLMKWTE